MYNCGTTRTVGSEHNPSLGGTGQGSVDTLRSLLTSYPRPVEFRRRRVGVSGVKIFADGALKVVSVVGLDGFSDQPTDLGTRDFEALVRICRQLEANISQSFEGD